MPSSYQENIAILSSLTIRNQACVVDAAAFWLNDVGDTEKHIEIELSSQKKWLKFIQNFGKKCNIYPIDGKKGVFKKKMGESTSACDVLVVNDKFRFIELKLNATSIESPLQMQENREKASLQLGRTLTYFKENTPESTFTKENCLCIIAVPNAYQYPRIAKKNNISVLKRLFLNKYKLELQEITPNFITELDQ